MIFFFWLNPQNNPFSQKEGYLSAYVPLVLLYQALDFMCYLFNLHKNLENNLWAPFINEETDNGLATTVIKSLKIRARIQTWPPIFFLHQNKTGMQTGNGERFASVLKGVLNLLCLPFFQSPLQSPASPMLSKPTSSLLPSLNRDQVPTLEWRVILVPPNFHSI